MACCGSSETARDQTFGIRTWRPLIYRRCTDLPWLILWFLFWTGMMFIAGYSITAGSAERLIFGHDSFGNVCGRKNLPIKGAALSGKDMTHHIHIFLLNSCNLKIKNLRINSVALCVSSCPQKQLNTAKDLQTFAERNGSYLCVYSLNSSEYTDNSKSANLCPPLPVSSSKSSPFFHHCVPQNPECYRQFVPVLVGTLNEVDFFHRMIAGIMASKESITGLSLLAAVFSVIMVLMFRFITSLVMHIFITLLAFGLVFVSSILWWLYFDHVTSPIFELETEKENSKYLLGFACSSSVISVVIFLLIFTMWKTLGLVIEMFQLANKIIHSVPLLFVQSMWTFVILMFFWVYWITVLLSLGTAGAAFSTPEGFVNYKAFSSIRYMWWYHVLGLLWTSEFILACHQMTIAGAVVRVYFNRDKNNPPSHPVLSSIMNVFGYHLGTVVKGSLIVMLVRVPRIVLIYIHRALKGKENSCARCMAKCCFCCLWCLEKFLRHQNQNAYTATSINGTNFCTSTTEAFAVIMKHSLSLADVNSSGDFSLFLGKVFVVCFTFFSGLMVFSYQQVLQVWVIPLLLISFLSYSVAHCFLSVFERVVDVLFLCYAIDLETNDGSTDKPYFMNKELMEFMNRSKQEILTMDTSQSKSHEGSTELQPMA
ncbi:choline transporter-like protein 3 isoform X1 [Polypterus senegalus]|uniref:choline transporter-like protein 3 isoform X1 n=2 Tax=Polypterus senegalus TaxID=55291 RepID=UPI0019631628|nr:choline transporter-like protein 3 isoform X1 [Polypterus senegalus]